MTKVWTIPALKEHLECKIHGLKDLVFGVLDERAKAVTKELADARDRANASNEIRGAMVDQQKNFADKESTDRRFDQLKEQLAEVRAEVAAERNSRSGSSGNWKTIGAIILAVAAINGIIFVIQGAAH